MKKTLCVLFAAVLLLAVSIPAMAATNMKLAHNLAEDHAVHIQLTAFADAVREKTGGEINIEVVPNGTLGSEGAVLEQVGYGMVEMTKVSAATLGQLRLRVERAVCSVCVQRSGALLQCHGRRDREGAVRYH